MILSVLLGILLACVNEGFCPVICVIFFVCIFAFNICCDFLLFIFRRSLPKPSSWIGNILEVSEKNSLSFSLTTDRYQKKTSLF